MSERSPDMPQCAFEVHVDQPEESIMYCVLEAGHDGGHEFVWTEADVEIIEGQA